MYFRKKEPCIRIVVQSHCIHYVCHSHVFSMPHFFFCPFFLMFYLMYINFVNIQTMYKYCASFSYTQLCIVIIAKFHSKCDN